MKPVFNRKQLSELLNKQFEHYMRHNPQISLDEEWYYLPFFDLANSLYQRSCSDRYRILHKWLEPETEPAPQAKNKSDNKTNDDIFLDPDYIASYMSGEYLFKHEYKGSKVEAELDGKFLIENPSLLFYHLARASEMEEYDIICAFHGGEGLELSEYELYCAYDIFDYYYKESGLTEISLSKLINQKGYSPQSISILLDRTKALSLENFLVLAEALQIPDEWKQFGQCCLAHRQDPFFYMYGYQESLADHAEPMYMYPLLQEGADEQQIWGTVSQLYDYLGYTALNLPPSWENPGNYDDTAVFGIMKPYKKRSSNTDRKNKENKRNGNIYKMQVSHYKTILEDVAEYAEFILEKVLREKNN